MVKLEVGDDVIYTTNSGNIYIGTITKCWGSNTYRGPFAYPDNCAFTVTNKEIINNIGYEYPIGSTIMVHNDYLKKYPEQATLENVINKKARNAVLRQVYEYKTGQSGQPGHGPANILRSMLNLPQPRGRLPNETNKFLPWKKIPSIKESTPSSRKSRKSRKTRRSRK